MEIANQEIEMILFVIVLQCFLSTNVKGFTLYISPVAVVNESCTVSDNTTLRPCYTLQQLSSQDNWLLNITQLTLLFLPGTHHIKRTFILSQLVEMEIFSWDEQQTIIRCEQEAGLVFKDIDQLNISSLHFDSCYVTCERGVKASYINNCTFAKSAQTFAFSFNSLRSSRIKIVISNSVFSSNNGGLYCNPGRTLLALNITDTLFINNWRKAGGGALYSGFAYIQIRRCVFINNSADSGGAIHSDGYHLISDTVFQTNAANVGSGGAIFSSDTRIVSCYFENNSAKTSGGAIYMYATKNPQPISVTINNTVFQDNRCGAHGGAIAALDILIFQLYNSKFGNNTAHEGGAIHLIRNAVLINSQFVIENSILQQNSASSRGGALYFNHPAISNGCDRNILMHAESFTWMNSCHFDGNSAQVSGGAMYYGNSQGHSTDVTLHNSSFTHNQAINGGAVFWGCSTTGRCDTRISSGFRVVGNSAIKGGAFYAENSLIVIYCWNDYGESNCTDYTTVLFAENKAELKGGALFLDRSNIEHTQNIVFAHNAVSSEEKGKGGAIYVEDDIDCWSDICFVFFSNKTLQFIDNSATYGSVLYGGLLDRCQPDEDNPGLTGIDYFRNISTYEPTPLAIASDPVRICLCNSENQIDCSTREIKTTKMRGETIKLKAISVDQYENPGLSIIRAFYVEPLAELDVGEWRNTANRMCTNLSYHIFTVESSATLVLQLLDKCEDSTQSTITFYIQLTPCSRGFELHNNTCACDRRLAQYFDVCNIDTRSVQRKGPTWLRYDQHHLKLSTNCPLDYCQVSSPTISLLFPDQQCANHRSGVLCGACKDNYSISLGGSKCSRCTSSYAAIGWTVLFAVAGLALVALLLVCNMTISAGTLNGLIFYANVVSISGLTSLHNCSLCPILRVFLAWLNLDWGLQTCFYSGMDTYHKTWLQLAFPLYIWCLVTAIILASHYSSTAMRVFGTNNIAILATLFILSYTKILKTITTALSVTQVLQSHPDNTTHQLTPYRVWTYDGNVEYLKGKHVALFAVALFFLLFLFLPYTLLLIFGQCVRSMSVKRCLCVSRCVRSTAFVSILDAYHAPYNKRHRYWTGLMLLTRCLLFLAFASSSGNIDPLLNNMYITAIVTFFIVLYKVFVRNVYKQVFTNVLEMCFLVNLEILSATLTFLKGSNSSSEVLCRSSNASISISLILFLLILTYHTYLQLQKRRWFVQLKDSLLTKWPLKYYHTTAAEDNSHVLTDRNTNISAPTTTFLELREELLASEHHKKN